MKHGETIIKRERERDRETERHTDRQTDRQTARVEEGYQNNDLAERQTINAELKVGHLTDYGDLIGQCRSG